MALLSRPRPGFWPAVWWLLVGRELAGILVYKEPNDMFWPLYTLIGIDEAVYGPGFWSAWCDREDIAVRNAWSGEDAPYTFPAGWMWTAREPVLVASLRSLEPRSATCCTSPAAVALRDEWRALIERCVPAVERRRLEALCADFVRRGRSRR